MMFKKKRVPCGMNNQEASLLYTTLNMQNSTALLLHSLYFPQVLAHSICHLSPLTGSYSPSPCFVLPPVFSDTLCLSSSSRSFSKACSSLLHPYPPRLYPLVLYRLPLIPVTIFPSHRASFSLPPRPCCMKAVSAPRYPLV